MKIENPIFIVGVGRSGSTVFHQIMCTHPRTAWLSALCKVFPLFPRLNALWMRTISLPAVGKCLQRIIRPLECYNFWERYCPGFRRPHRDLLESDVTEENTRRVQSVMSKMLNSKRDRLLIKITGWPRIGFLKAIFPDAKFIHILRDGRAVSNSMLQVEWWHGWMGPDSWRWGELSDDQRILWEKHDKSIPALAGIEWNILMGAMEEAKSRLPKDDFLEFKYEDMCEDPERIFKKVADFTGLEWSNDFKSSIRQFSLRNTNNKWEKDLTSEEQAVLQDVIHDNLLKHDYL